MDSCGKSNTGWDILNVPINMRIHWKKSRFNFLCLLEHPVFQLEGLLFKIRFRYKYLNVGKLQNLNKDYLRNTKTEKKNFQFGFINLDAEKCFKFFGLAENTCNPVLHGTLQSIF